MGLFDDLFSNSSTAQSKTNQTTNTSENKTTTTLDPATMKLLQGLVQQLGGQTGNTGVDAGTLRTLAGQLVSTSQDTTALDNSIGTAQDKARLDYNNTTGKDIGILQNQIGSKGNTFSQLVSAQGQGDLQTNLAQIVATTKLQEQQQKMAGLEGAATITGQAADVGNTEANAPILRLLSVISALKGGSTTESGTAFSNMFGTTTGSQQNNPSIISDIGQLVALFGSS